MNFNCDDAFPNTWQQADSGCVNVCWSKRKVRHEQIPVLPGVSQNGKAPKSSERGLMGKDRERLDAFGGPLANKKT